MTTRHYFVRLGPFSGVGRFTSAEAESHTRGGRVICRTSRGLELGEVLSPVPSDASVESDGALLRRVTVEDDLLLARLDANRHEAFEACQHLLAERGLAAVLMDVELLFDGASLYFYFLGGVSPEVEQLTDELAEAYEAKVQFRRFTEAVVEGCGPDCGTEAAAGCGDGCSTCGLVTECKTK